MRFLLTFLLGLGAQAPQPPDWANLFNHAQLESIVMVSVDDSFCTGEFVAPRKVLTAYHCFGNGTTGAVVDQFGKAYAFESVVMDPAHDLALITVKVPNKIPMRLAADEAKPTQPVMSVGYHVIADSLVLSHIEGYVIGIAAEYGIVDTKVIHGFSGGPVLNAQGELEGVNDALTHHGFTLYIPLQYIKALIEAK